MITSLDQLDFSKRYSYADYLTWRFQERVELIAGRIFRMSPGPSRRHQEILGDFYRQISNYLLKEPCKVYIAPFDVRFAKERHLPNDKVYDTVQPDLCVVCDHTKLDKAGCIGAPDFILEVISPSSVKRDLQHKFDLYERHDVLEYWVIDPLNQTVTMNVMQESGSFQAFRPYVIEGRVASKCIRGFELDLSTIFDEPEDWTLVSEPTVPYTAKSA